jgi:hypothetical protein
MVDEDFDWAAELLDRRRRAYEAYSPVFWRPAQGIAAAHAAFLRTTAARPDAVALRTAGGFAVSIAHEGRCFVDDFAVEEPELWATEGRDLLLATWAAARSDEQATLRVVTARRDEPKRDLLVELGLTVAARWWVKELEPASAASAWGPVTLEGAPALIMPAPPVYDPGGPVCLLGDIASDQAGAAAAAAASLGAVLAIVQRERATSAVPSDDPALDAAGFHNPSEFYEGDPASPREPSR